MQSPRYLNELLDHSMHHFIIESKDNLNNSLFFATANKTWIPYPVALSANKHRRILLGAS